MPPWLPLTNFQRVQSPRVPFLRQAEDSTDVAGGTNHPTHDQSVLEIVQEEEDDDWPPTRSGWRS